LDDGGSDEADEDTAEAAVDEEPGEQDGKEVDDGGECNPALEHGGFNWYAFQESVEDNLEAGAFVRGASTVSMQLVKNVFLSFDKVVARKIREAFLVWLMESVVDVPKARILELYFNIIEFGPGIFGIHDASVHYFGKRPDELTLSEVLWLVGIVPNPKEYHRYYERGKITDAWYETLVTYAEIMHERDRATKKDVERVRKNKPNFYKPDPG
ncbi:MAG: biosynthetic peptidoglycan transglycosylase, partial [Bradymonadaceae bacterium]